LRIYSGGDVRRQLRQADVEELEMLRQEFAEAIGAAFVESPVEAKEPPQGSDWIAFKATGSDGVVFTYYYNVVNYEVARAPPNEPNEHAPLTLDYLRDRMSSFRADAQTLEPPKLPGVGGRVATEDAFDDATFAGLHGDRDGGARVVQVFRLAGLGIVAVHLVAAMFCVAEAVGSGFHAKSLPTVQEDVFGEGVKVDFGTGDAVTDFGTVTIQSDNVDRSTLKALHGQTRIPVYWEDGFVPFSITCNQERVVVANEFSFLEGHLRSPAVNAEKGVSFKRAFFHCQTLEGEELQDVTLNKNNLYVLYKHGKRIGTCNGRGTNQTVWRMSQSWLKSRESATLIAAVPEKELLHMGVVVGTSRGRVILMQEDHFGGNLNPSAAVEEGQFESLDIDRGILVMLDRSVVHTIRLKDGRRLGTWTLPADIKFRGICTTKGHLYAISRHAGGELWRFDVPQILKDFYME
jgi:hypothetical protein